MTKKVPKKILRIERHFFVNLRKKTVFGRPHRAAAADFFGPAARRRRRPKLTGAPPPTQCGRRTALFSVIALYCTSLGPQPFGVQCLLTSSLGEFPGYFGLTPVSWTSARVVVQSPFPLRLPYLGVFPFTLHLPLDFIRVSSLRPPYLHQIHHLLTF